jgi:hypothetical protein
VHTARIGRTGIQTEVRRDRQKSSQSLEYSNPAFAGED